MSQGSMIMPIRVGDFGFGFTEENAAAGVCWAADNGAHVINMSFGDADWGKFLGPAVKYAYLKGLVLIASAGNSGVGGTMGYPASDPLVMTVGATNPDDERACFSTTATMDNPLSVAAPGIHIVSTWNDAVQTGEPGVCAGDLYCRWSGTSFAAPQVAGLASLILSVNLGFTNDEVRQIIESTADDLGAAGFDVEFGHGRINAYVAVCTARGMRCMGDINNDCCVNSADLTLLLGCWASGQLCGDLNCDSVTNSADLTLLLGAQWGPCPTTAFCPAPPPGCGGQGAQGGGGSGPAALQSALAVMGFANVGQFQAWLSTASDAQAFACACALYALLSSQP